MAWQVVIPQLHCEHKIVASKKKRANFQPLIYTNLLLLAFSVRQSSEVNICKSYDFKYKTPFAVDISGLKN